MESKIKCWKQTIVIAEVLSGIILATANPNGERQDWIPATVDSVHWALRYQMECYPVSQYRIISRDNFRPRIISFIYNNTDADKCAN